MNHAINHSDFCPRRLSKGQPRAALSPAKLLQWGGPDVRNEEPPQAKHRQPNSRTDGAALTLHVRNTLPCPLPPSLYTSQAFVTTYVYNSAELKCGEYIKQPNGSKTDACDSEGAVMSAPLLRTQSRNMIRTGSEAGAITLVRGCSICVIGWERSETKPFRTST